jgi:glycosyltransferase involved in cell wall biosynthesis
LNASDAAAYRSIVRPAPTVSVITIFLDAERFLAEAVESVRAQTFTDWELLLVDDGSRDGSTAMARRLAAAEPGRIRYLRHFWHRNRGMSATRNLGIRHARGRYVAFLDSDDVLLPHALAEEVALLEAHADAAMVWGRTLYWHGGNGSNEAAGMDHPDRPARGGPPVLIGPPQLVPRFLEEGIAPCICSLLLRRSALREVGGFERRFRGLYEDQALYAKVALRYGVLECDNCWSKYRQHPAATCVQAAASGGIPAARRRYLLWLEEYVARSRVTEPLVRECLERVLAPFRSDAAEAPAEGR